MASKTKVHYVVNCARHGSESSLWAGKQIKVGKPRNKRERNTGGCPFCKKEREAAALASAAGELTPA